MKHIITNFAIVTSLFMMTFCMYLSIKDAKENKPNSQKSQENPWNNKLHTDIHKNVEQ